MAEEAYLTLNDTPEAERATAPRYLRYWSLPSDNDQVMANYWTLFRALSLASVDLTFKVGKAAECINNAVAYTGVCGANSICICRDVFFGTPTSPGLSTEDHVYPSQQGTILHEMSHLRLGTDDNEQGNTPPLENAYNYDRFASNDPYLPMTTKPVVAQIVRRLQVPAGGTAPLSVVCRYAEDSDGFAISGGWENVVGNMSAYHSRRVNNGRWEVRVKNSESTAKTVGIRVNCLYNVSSLGSNVTVAEATRSIPLSTGQDPAYDDLDCSSIDGGGIPIGGGFSLANNVEVFESRMRDVNQTVKAHAGFKRTTTQSVSVVHTATCLQNITNVPTVRVRGATYDSSTGDARAACNENEVMTWAGFRVAEPTPLLIQRAVSSYQTRSGRATGYSGYLVPSFPGSVDPSKIEAVATCVEFPTQ